MYLVQKKNYIPIYFSEAAPNDILDLSLRMLVIHKEGEFMITEQMWDSANKKTYPTTLADVKY